MDAGFLLFPIILWICAEAHPVKEKQNGSCIRMTSERAAEITKIGEEVNIFLNELSDKHEGIDFTLVEFRIENHSDNEEEEDKETVLKITVNDCNVNATDHPKKEDRYFENDSKSDAKDKNVNRSISNEDNSEKVANSSFSKSKDTKSQGINYYSARKSEYTIDKKENHSTTPKSDSIESNSFNSKSEDTTDNKANHSSTSKPESTKNEYFTSKSEDTNNENLSNKKTDFIKNDAENIEKTDKKKTNENESYRSQNKDETRAYKSNDENIETSDFKQDLKTKNENSQNKRDGVNENETDNTKENNKDSDESSKIIKRDVNDKEYAKNEESVDRELKDLDPDQTETIEIHKHYNVKGNYDNSNLFIYAPHIDSSNSKVESGSFYNKLLNLILHNSMNNKRAKFKNSFTYNTGLQRTYENFPDTENFDYLNFQPYDLDLNDDVFENCMINRQIDRAQNSYGDFEGIFQDLR